MMMTIPNEKEHRLIDAMMLLEFVGQSEEFPLDKCGLGNYDVLDLVDAAHSLIQARTQADVSDLAKGILAKIEADTAIDNAIYRAKGN
jgi:hypothetical protein